MLRLHGDLMPIKFRELGDTELEAYVAEILSESQKQRFTEGMDLDFSYISEDGGRFRVNVFRKETGVGATFRNIPSAIPSMEPPLMAEEGSTASTATRWPCSMMVVPRASMKVDLPTPGTPEMPTRRVD